MSATIRIPQTTNPNQSGPMTSVELSPELAGALTDAGIDLDSVRVETDSTVYIDIADGGRVAIGDEDGWYSATAHDSDDEYRQVYEGRSLTDLATAVAAAVQ